jgi:hypothetical protein
MDERILVDKKFNYPNFQEKIRFFKTGRKSMFFPRRKKASADKYLLIIGEAQSKFGKIEF